MSNTITLKKSGVSGNAPSSSDLSLGEIAINYADGHLYYKSGASATPAKLNAGNADTTDGFHLNQDVRSTASPSFAGLDINGAADISGNLEVGEYILRSGQGSNYHRFLASRQIFVVGNATSIDLNNGTSTFGSTGGATTLQGSSLSFTGNATFAGTVTATSLIKSGGSSSEFLKADGSVDSSTYVSSSALSSYLPLAGGTITGNVKFNDGIELRLGSDADLKIYHNSNVSRIHNEVGDLYIENDATDGDILLRSDDGSGGITNYLQLDGGGVLTRAYKNFRVQDDVYLQAGSSGDLEIVHASNHSYINNKTGDLYITNSTDNGDVIFRSDNGSGGLAEYFKLDGSLAAADGAGTLFTIFPDNSRIGLGGNADLRLYHDGTNSKIINLEGNLDIAQYVDDADITFHSDNGSGGTTEYLRLDGGLGYSVASQHLRMADGKALYAGEGNDLGIYHVSGNSYIQNLTGELIIQNDANDNDIVFKSDNGSGGVTDYLRLDGSHTQMLATKNLHFDDNVELRFGDYASPDLKIYHDGNNSFIKDTGTGSLYIDGSQNVFIRDTNGQVWFQGNAGGVNLRYQDSVKIQTTSSGVSVTGSMLANAAVVNQITAATSSGSIKFKNNAGSDKAIILDNGNFGIGITDPDTELEVGGTIKASTHSDAIVIGSPTTVKWKMGVYGANDLLIRDPSNNTKLSILADGKVGIGTTSPAHKLDVNGGIRANGNIVTTTASQIIASRKFSALNTSGVMLTDSGTSNGLSIANGGNATFSHNLTVSGDATISGDLTVSTDFEAGAAVQFSALANAGSDVDKFLVSDSGDVKFRTGAEVLSDIGGQASISAPNAPASASAAIVGETVEVTFAASTTSNIDAYLVFSSIDGSDYGLISVIPPDDFAASMSIIDNAFDETGTQAYRVYAVKYGILSSATTASVSYSISSLEPTNMSVINLNNAFYVQWDQPSSNARFVSAYNVYKHEHATQGSLSRNSASLIYSGRNTNYMYQISGTNNNNFHQFWVETTIA